MHRSTIVLIAASALAPLLALPPPAVAGSKTVAEQNNPAFDPFQAELFPKDPICGEVEVPSGKRLVIEYVSARIEEGGSSIIVRTTASGSTADHHIATSEVEVGIVIASELVRLYADPETSVEVCSTGLGTAAISGYLVPLP